ncbi:hypothetical protein [Serratia marcescens]|uniref:hypothetical protein n=1 Tax=Serratia marcescens TaxID=615 RepID=UPI0007450951|nr:hypothetical protein [Serratia marcescens]CUY61208.1 Uncharacterised protein [Serratia marcescens]CUY67325.1 Uncharacterised protein [Serratia marcescens]CVA66087.1 Uncharacterised protein [Serratia marcescens]CVA69386.1 Uncharacterised protein [Serratia marcescens]CVA72315.1 Uncharacterised protein [Serratia marcescens]
MVQRYNPDYVMHAARFEPFARENEHGEFVKFSDYEALKAERDALAVENQALKRERSELSAIGELIRTQDNRITDQPFFAVMTKREIVASEDHDCDRICWVENQSGNYVEATETQHRRLEAIYQAKYEVRDGWDRYAMKEIDVFVTGCFTEQGCKDYINKNGHNLNKPFIYAFGSYRNDEYQTVRKFIMQIPETPATDSALAAIREQACKALIDAFVRQVDAAGLDDSDSVTIFECRDTMKYAAEQVINPREAK